MSLEELDRLNHTQFNLLKQSRTIFYHCHAINNGFSGFSPRVYTICSIIHNLHIIHSEKVPSTMFSSKEFEILSTLTSSCFNTPTGVKSLFTLSRIFYLKYSLEASISKGPHGYALEQVKKAKVVVKRTNVPVCITILSYIEGIIKDAYMDDNGEEVWKKIWMWIWNALDRSCFSICKFCTSFYSTSESFRTCSKFCETRFGNTLFFAFALGELRTDICRYSKVFESTF